MPQYPYDPNAKDFCELWFPNLPPISNRQVDWIIQLYLIAYWPKIKDTQPALDLDSPIPATWHPEWQEIFTHLHTRAMTNTLDHFIEDTLPRLSPQARLNQQSNKDTPFRHTAQCNCCHQMRELITCAIDQPICQPCFREYANAALFKQRIDRQRCSPAPNAHEFYCDLAARGFLYEILSNMYAMLNDLESIGILTESNNFLLDRVNDI